VTTIIIGAKRPDQLDDNLAAVDIELSADELANLNEVSALQIEYPAWMFTRQGEVRAKQLAEEKK
jgi:diketogulonate reductase-like aldo/keto reductase